MDDLPLDLQQMVGSYESGYNYIVENYYKTYSDLKRTFNPDIAAKYATNGNVTESLLSDPDRALQIVSDFVSQETVDQNILELLRTTYSTMSPVNYSFEQIIKLAEIQANLLEKVINRNDLIRPIPSLSLSDEMFSLLLKKFPDDMRMRYYALLVGDMDTYETLIEKYKKSINLLGDINYVKTENLSRFFEIVKDSKINVSDILESHRSIEKDRVRAMIDYFKQPLSFFYGSSDLLKHVLDENLLEKGADVLLTSSPSKEIWDRLNVLDTRIKILK